MCGPYGSSPAHLGAISLWPSEPACLSAFLSRVLSSQTAGTCLSQGARSSGCRPAWAQLAQILFLCKLSLHLLVRGPAVGRPWVESGELDWQPPGRVAPNLNFP